MENKLVVAPSPHVHAEYRTRRLMLDVVIALMPALAMSTFIYGWRVLAVTAFAVLCCVVFEYLIQKYMLRGPLTIDNMSAVVTGVLLAFNLPMSIPLWMVALGCAVAIGIGKMTYGGLGKNIFNPALVGRVFLLVSFPVAMTTFPQAADAFSGATPLTYVREALKSGVPMDQIATGFSHLDFWLGYRNGCMGEISSVMLVVGFVYLLLRRVITWHIPVFVLGTMAAFSAILWGIAPQQYASPMFQLLTGGALLGAIYMATDYVTSPMTYKGMLLYGIGIGALTILIRVWGNYPEGMSFAILIMNAFVPLIDKYIRPKRFGETLKPSKP